MSSEMRVSVSWSSFLFGFVFQAWKVEEAKPPSKARDCSSFKSHFLRRFMNALMAAAESSARSEALPRSAPDSKSYPAILGSTSVAEAAAIGESRFRELLFSETSPLASSINESTNRTKQVRYYSYP